MSNVRGHWRKLRSPKSKGVGPNGEAVSGKTWVKGYTRTVSTEKVKKVEDIELYNRDLVTELIRIKETNYGREPNWCRGIEIYEDRIFCTIDGRYDSDLSFGILELSRTGETKEITRLKWDEIGNADDIRYVTGFDLIHVQ